MKIQYKSRLVTFIDVLGFKNLVYATKLEAIETYYEFLLSSFTEAIKKRSFEFLLISDSIAIYCDDSLENLEKLIKLGTQLQAGLLSKGILVRGAISHGDLFVNAASNIVVGPGLINAYSLEAVARYPRVIVDRTIIQKYYGSTQEAIARTASGSRPNLSNAPHNSGISDHLYLHYGRFLAGGVTATPYEQALQLLKREYYKNEHIEKFEWLRKYLISALGESIDYLSGKLEPTKNEKNKLRNNRKYVDLFKLL